MAAAGAGPFIPAFAQNVFVAQQENAQVFEAAIKTGANMIILQVVSGAGMRFVAWIYDARGRSINLTLRFYKKIIRFCIEIAHAN